MSQRWWRIGIRPIGSRCREQRSGRSIPPGFVLVDSRRYVRFCFRAVSQKARRSTWEERSVACDLAPWGQMDAATLSLLLTWTIFFLPVVSDTAAGLLPRVALATQVAIETAREHGLQLNMASNKTEAVVDFRGKGRQQVLEDLALEFPVVDGQWTPTVHVADGVLLRLVSTYRHLGTQASHGARRGPELAARRSAARAAYHATRKKILSQRRLSKKARVAVARAVVSSRLLYAAGAWHSLSASDVGAMEDTYMAPFRTIANERWRPRHVPASSQEVRHP